MSRWNEIFGVLLTDLLRALEEGILISGGSAYKWLYGVREGEVETEWLEQFRVVFQFSHDRVQQAAYEMLSNDERKLLHVKIGRWLSRSSRAVEMEDRLFERVNHLNEALDLIEMSSEREELSRLNLEAGKRAKATTAYEQALYYMSFGTNLLVENCWESQHELAFELYRGRFELEYLCGHEQKSEAIFDLLLRNAKTVHEKFSVYEIKIILYTFEDRVAEAVQIGKEALSTFGFKGSLNRNRYSFWLAVQKLKRKLRQNPLDETSITMATDPFLIAQTNMMVYMGHPAYYIDQNLYRALVMKIVENCLAYGFTEFSCGSFVGIGFMIKLEFGDYKTADVSED